MEPLDALNNHRLLQTNLMKSEAAVFLILEILEKLVIVPLVPISRSRILDFTSCVLTEPEAPAAIMRKLLILWYL